MVLSTTFIYPSVVFTIVSSTTIRTSVVGERTTMESRHHQSEHLNLCLLVCSTPVPSIPTTSYNVGEMMRMDSPHRLLEGGVDCPSSSFPQHCNWSLVSMAQEWNKPADTDLNVPTGGVDSPSLFFPQQLMF